MYAIVDIAGQQFKVEKDQKLFVHRLEVEEGKKVSFDKVLLIDTGSKVSVGDPVVRGAIVDAKVISHMKGDKILVFKKKRRKGYQKLNGHRQYLTQIQIEGISEKGATAKKETAASKKEEAPAAKTTAAKATAAKKPAAKAAPKATAEKKPAAKKPAAKKPAAKTASKTTAEKKPAAKKPAVKAAPKKESGDKA
ncbi:MAG: 50S ribosomal protein L21 [Bacteroidota bacterium]|nr:50S ribosomal protein L21 [Bacteroidota bacterium]